MVNVKIQSISTVFIVSAASGTGKTSLLNALSGLIPHIQFSVSHTTRPPRNQEKNGIHYHFISQDQFETMITQNEFLEFAHVFGHYYGTSQTEIERALKMQQDILLEIDVQGAEQVRRQLSHTVSIFILPPSRQILEQRITSRKQGSPEDVTRRLNTSRNEIAHCKEYDYIIINDDFNDALADLIAIIRSERCRRNKQIKKHQALLHELME